MRRIFFIMALIIVGTLGAAAQSAKTKALMAEVRVAYAKAVKMGEEGTKGARKNHQVFNSVVTDPGGKEERKIEFVFDNSDKFEEIGVYPCTLVLLRETVGSFYNEYLYDADGKVLFFFKRMPAEVDGQTREYRAYFDTDNTGWVIDKTIDSKTKRVVSEYPSDLDYEMEIWDLRHASELLQAFRLLNAIHD